MTSFKIVKLDVIILQMNILVFILLCLVDLYVDAEFWHLHNLVEYFVSYTAQNIEKAISSCETMHGAKLVMIQTEDKQVFLEGLFANNSNYSSGNY